MIKEKRWSGGKRTAYHKQIWLLPSTGNSISLLDDKPKIISQETHGKRDMPIGQCITFVTLVRFRKKHMREGNEN